MAANSGTPSVLLAKQSTSGGSGYLLYAHTRLARLSEGIADCDEQLKILEHMKASLKNRPSSGSCLDAPNVDKAEPKTDNQSASSILTEDEQKIMNRLDGDITSREEHTKTLMRIRALKKEKRRGSLSGFPPSA